MPVILLILGAGTATLLVALLYAYGEQYPIIWGYIILEAAGIAFQGIYYFFSSLLVMEGETGARTSFEILGKPYVFLLLISFVCTKLFGLTGGFVSFTANQAILAVLLVIRYRRTLRIGESEEKHYSFNEI
jgi:O-antigen/teichoic acid export membrane protein